jgi:CHAT domain-containing protein
LNHYLVHHYQISYLTTAQIFGLPRRAAVNPDPKTGLPEVLLAGGINYNAPPDGPVPVPVPVPAVAKVDKLPRARPMAVPPRGVGGSEAFPALVESLLEVNAASEALSKRFRAVWLKPPTEKLFKEVAPGKRLLILATHGYVKSLPPSLASSEETGIPVAGIRPESEADAPGPHPWLRCGLAFQGANYAHLTDLRSAPASEPEPDGSAPRSDDGILTGLEIAQLDLSTVELVVLSACKTGDGLYAQGEGLQSLQRAFEVAGSRTVVATLWDVRSGATSRLTGRFFDALKANPDDPALALRMAQQAMIATNGPLFAHPRQWAAWVPSGDPRSPTSAAPAH